MEKFMTLKSFQNKYKSEQACLKALLEFRMSEDRLCFNENCKGSIDRYYHRLRGRKAFICSRCLMHIYPMSGSIFDHTHVSLQEWFEVIFKFLYCRNGISAKEIHRVHGYSYPTAFRMLHSIRELMFEALQFDLENTVVEIDETAVSCGNFGFGRHFSFGKGRGNKKMATVVTITERKGVAKLFAVPASDADTLIQLIKQHVPKSTIIYTDSFKSYNSLVAEGYMHVMVNHSIYEFTKGSASTNSAEATFSNLKRGIGGTYRDAIGEGKIQNYLNEAAFRHSFRFEHDYGFEHLIKTLPSLSYTYGDKTKAA